MTDKTTFDEILYGKLRLFQPVNGPRVNVDTILLSAFAKVKKGEKAIELGSAHGAVSLLLALRFPGAVCIEGLEIQESLWTMGVENIRENHLEHKVRFTLGDLKKVSDIYEPQSFDVLVTNPPYFTEHGGRRSHSSISAVANHGLSCSLKDVVRASSYLLRNKGRLYLIFNADRIDELMSVLTNGKLMVKRIRPVYPRPGRKASVVLVHASKNAGAGMMFDKPLIICDENGLYSADLEKAYELDDSPCL